MSHKLHRLTSSLYNTPLLIEQNAFKGILNYLNERNDVGIKALDDSDHSNAPTRFGYNEDTQTGLIELVGPLTAKPVTIMGFDCGGANYLHLKEDFESLISMGAKTIAMIVDSPGGEAYSMSDSAVYIRNLLDANGVKLITYIEGMAASAGYGVACISDEIHGSWDSEAGSIGVLVQLWNDSKALEKEGYERTFVTAGKSKVPYSADGSFREGFIQDIQDKVDVCYKNFTEHVALHRGMPVENVMATEAKMFFAQDAVKLGLMDSIMTSEEFFTYLASESQTNMENTPVNVNRMFKFSKTEEVEQMKLEELQAQLTAAVTEKTEMTAQLTTMKASLESMVSENERMAEALASVEDAKEAALQELAQFKTDTKLSTRKASLMEAKVAADKVEGIVAATASLDEDAFGVILQGYSAQASAIEQSSLMQEIGGEGVDLSADTTDESTEAAALTRAAMARLKPQSR